MASDDYTETCMIDCLKSINNFLSKVNPLSKLPQPYPLSLITDSKLDEVIIDSETGEIEIKKDELYKSSFFSGQWIMTGYSPVCQVSGDSSKKIDEPSEIS